MEELILKYLNREHLSAEEKARLKKWLAKSKKNQQVFNQLKLNLEGTGKETVDKMQQETWEDLSARINAYEQLSRDKRTGTPRWFRFAASLLLVFIFGALLYFYTKPATQSPAATSLAMVQKESLYGQKRTFLLPDGSTVKLNAGSKITFPGSFGTKSREVSLQGEAFFQVEEDPKRPFVIVSKGIRTEVLGTSFVIRAYEEDAQVHVAVKSGRVAVSTSEEGKKLLLAPDEMARYSEETKEISKQVVEDPSLFFGWTDQALVFKRNNLQEVLKTASRWYDVDFNITVSVPFDKRFTGSYKNPTLDELMTSLAYAYDFNYKIEDKNVTIY